MSRAMLCIFDEGQSIAEVAKDTGINLRALYRYKDKYIKGKQPPRQKKKHEMVVYKESTVPSTELQKNVDSALIERAKFMQDVFETKQIILQRIKLLGDKSKNIDALQRTLKTLNELEGGGQKKEDSATLHADTVNMFQFFNQQLIDEGYEGPPLTDADIVKGM